ncbi:hypothetical protein Acsp04_18680 [Actinomadura sp. NBRC 104425]|nr:hypothetical protein Acsp04_18680 [Actinomadura sp. NBRC 104425]
MLMAAVRVAYEQGFDREELDTSSIPNWFISITDGGSHEEAIPVEVLAGRNAYYAARDQNEWDVQEWLFCFDPDLRYWHWWDLTSPGDRVAVLWIDTRGEWDVPCEELWWAVYAAGARSAEGLIWMSADEWRRQPSIGIT